MHTFIFKGQVVETPHAEFHIWLPDRGEITLRSQEDIDSLGLGENYVGDELWKAPAESPLYPVVKDTVISCARLNLGWKDRLRVLIGRTIEITVKVDSGNIVDVLGSSTRIYIPRRCPISWFRKKQPAGMGYEYSPKD